MPGFDSTRDALSQGIVAAILVGVFALLAADRVHRVLIPIGAVALVWLISYFSPFRLISFEAAQQAVDLNVILLLFAMMALVGVLKTTNVFPWAVDRLLERSRGNPSRAARLIIWFTGILSAILDNVTTVIFTYPMASEMARRLRINGSAFFLPMVMAANIGGTATLIGDPPNVLIGADPRTGLSFMSFIYNLTMPCTFMMIVLVWYSRRYYPADIGRGAECRPRRRRPADRARSCRTCRCCAPQAGSRVLIFLGFMTHTLTHMPVAVPAVIGVAAILFAQDYYYLKEHKPTAGGAPARGARHPGEGHRMADPGLLPVPVHPGRRRGGDRPDREPGARPRLADCRDLRWARSIAQGDSPGGRPDHSLGLGRSLGVDRQHPLHRRHHPAGGEPARPAQCRRRRPGPVVGAGARRLPGRQRHPDRRLGQRHGHRASPKRTASASRSTSSPPSDRGSRRSRS